MPQSISASVGQNGANRADDVRIIQNLLNNLPEDEGRPNPLLTVDGAIGPKTVAAIRAFQESQGLVADGRVDPGGATLKALNEFAPEDVGAAVIISFADGARRSAVSKHSITVLTDILTAAQLTRARVTSTQRTPADQARIMYQNIKTKGVASQKALYGDFGDKVIEVYESAQAAGKTEGETRALMEKKIWELGPSNVSKHLADPAKLNVVDVAPTSISSRNAFEQAVKADVRVSKFLTPPSDPAYHLEIPQPQ